MSGLSGLKTWGIYVCVALTLLSVTFAADGLSEKFQKKIDTAEAAYQTVVKKADNTRFYAVQKANTDRLKAFKQTLTEATKAGDFDAATLLKEKITAAESLGASRPKPKETVKFNGHEYALIDEKATWHVAQRMCEQMGGHLVTFETPQEQAFVVAACRTANQAAWIGVSNELKIEEWQWVTGQRTTLDPSWAVDNADLDAFSRAFAYWPNTGNINDMNMGYHMGFVCEWDN